MSNLKVFLHVITPTFISSYILKCKFETRYGKDVGLKILCDVCLKLEKSEYELIITKEASSFSGIVKKCC